ncbi:MAG: ATP-dependent Clp protease proteolytic subunit [Planctomycetota bacterium]
MRIALGRQVASLSLLAALAVTPALAQEAGPAGPTPPATPAKKAEEKAADKAGEKPLDKAGEEEKKAPEKDPEIERLEAQKKKLLEEIKDVQEAHKLEIARMQAEVAKLSAEAQLRSARTKASLANQSEEIERIQADAQLRRAREETEAYELQKKLNEIKNRTTLRKLQELDELSDLQGESVKIQTKLGLERAKRQAEMEAMTADRERMEAEAALIASRMRLAEIKRKAQLEEASRINDELALMGTKEKAKDVVTEEVDYPDRPFSHGRLVISDRRISLNEPIITGTADYVCKRIDFFNNQSTSKPIFLVIDRCPGGSVMEGYRIVKTMQASKAPIHVVVKSYAASMAAVITTLADHSYAYPNAVILHHQMSTGASGNMSQIKQQLDEAREWERRLMEPVCKKIGLTREAFIKSMYEHNVDGDWAEFADQAVKMRWVNEVVDEIREAGVTKRPQGEAPRPWYFGLFGQEQKDEHGRPFRTLPRLGPYDFYMIHNPDQYWRMR